MRILKSIILAFGLILLCLTYSFAQTASFTVTSPICQEENVPLINTSTGSDSYVWDFCFDALSNVDNSIDLGSFNDATNPEGITIGYDAGNWYGFLLGRDNNKLLRLEFGSDLSNTTPVIVDLGNLLGLIAGPVELRLIKESGNWYGLLINLTGNKLTRLEFGTNLNGIPGGVDLGNLSSWSTVRGLDVVWDGARWIGVVTTYINNKVTMLNFGTSIVNNSPIVLDVAVGDPLFSGLFGVGLQTDGANWYGLLSGFANDKILYLDYGTDLMTDPSVTDIGTYDRAAGVSFVRDGEVYYGFVLGTMGITRINFGNELAWDGNELIEDLGNLDILSNEFGISIVKAAPEWKIFSIAQSSKEISRIDFKDMCSDLPINSSVSTNPTGLNYSTSGNRVIELTAFSSTGERDVEEQTISITTSTAPIMDFQNTTCFENPVAFTHTSNQTLTTTTWDFGDGTPTSPDPNPSHQYASTGIYTVRLTVESDNGCGQFLEKDITIYNAPVASYTVPAGLLCSNDPIVFTNTSTFDAGSPTTWLWDFGDGSPTSTEQAPTHTFAEGNTYTVTLTATLPTCSDVYFTDVLIEEGPATDFSFLDVCSGAPVQFADLTTGTSPITNWLWDFGDGNTSDQPSLDYSYSAPGTYGVTLTTTNQIGCSTLKTQTVIVHSNPIASFHNELACEGALTFFFDDSTVDNANNTAWQWDFGDGTPVDTLQSPSHLYATSGNYTFSLKVTSNYGCTDSIASNIDVLIAASPIFSFDKSCLGDPTQFTNETTTDPSNPVASTTWLIDGKIFTGPNPTYTFPSQGTYTVSLTVVTENQCLVNYMEDISVNPDPIVSFGYSQACNNGPVTFYDTSTTFNDPVVSRTWQIDGKVFAQDSVVSVIPDTTGIVKVSLSVITANGCSNSILDNVDILASPSAGFGMNTAIGAYPLEVDFVNTSSDATSYAWRFDADTVQSTDLNPSYTFVEPGMYDVLLVTGNNIGCTDTVMQKVEVVEPVMDVLLNQMNPKSGENGRVQLILDIQNKGSVTMTEENLEIRIDIGKDVSITESFNDVLFAFESTNYTLNFEFDEGIENSVPSICVELVPLNAPDPQTQVSNTLQCLNFKTEPVFFKPFPNPSSDRVSVGIFIPEKDDVYVTWMDSNGKVVFRKKVSDTQPGYNVISFDAQIYHAGTYFVSTEYRGVTQTFKVVVN